MDDTSATAIAAPPIVPNVPKVLDVFQKEYNGERVEYNDIWVERDGPQDVGRFRHEEAIRYAFVVDALKAYKEPRVVDLGCNIGAVIRLLVEDRIVKAENAYGLDLDAAYIEYARAYVPGATFVRSAIEYAHDDLPGEFDVVIVYEVIEHVADLGRAMWAIASIVKPGGTVVFSTPDGGVNNWARKYCRAYPDRHRLCLTVYSLSEACETAGLRIKEFVQVPPRWDGFAYFLMSAVKPDGSVKD